MRKTYEQYITENDTAWMTADGFFMGTPDVQLDAPVSAVIRAAVYSYIRDRYRTRKLGMMDADRWGEIYRAELTAINGVFWKMWQMDQLLEVVDMVRADYTEYIQNYDESTGKQLNESTGTTENTNIDEMKYDTINGEVVMTDDTTLTDGENTTTRKPLGAARTIAINSNLAESSYIDPIVSENSDGMPELDTTIGDSAAGGWSISEHTEEKTTRTPSTSTSTSKTEEVKVEQTAKQRSAGASLRNDANFVERVNSSIGGMVRTGRRDYDGYNLSASIAAVVQLLPYDVLDKRLNKLFYGVVDLFGGELYG